MRAHIVEPLSGEDTRSATPYAPGSTFFFELKFSEPYMVYRDWREMAKKLLSAKEKGKGHPTGCNSDSPEAKDAGRDDAVCGVGEEGDHAKSRGRFG